LNKIKIYKISISIFAVSVSLLINSSYAQPIDNFLNYSNNQKKFSIQYPADWEVKETDLIDDEAVVEFTAPDRSAFSILLHNVTKYLDTDTMTLKNTTLQEYVQSESNIASKMGQPDPNIIYKPIRSNEFSVAGNLGWKIEYIWGYIAEMYYSRIFTNANDKIYELKYNALPGFVPDTLPLANKMVESFQFNTE
jgi:hypothetical protein